MRLYGGYNSLLYLLANLDRNFCEDYVKVSKSIPNKIVEKCNQGKKIEYSDDKIIVSMGEINKGQAKQLTFDYVNHNSDIESIGIDALYFSKEALEKMPISEVGKENYVTPLIFRINYLIKDKDEYEYTFRVNIGVINKFFDDMDFELTSDRPEDPNGEVYNEYLQMAKDIVKIITGKEFEEDRSKFKYPNEEEAKAEEEITEDSGEWFCPKCGTKNQGNFCMKCGTQKPVVFTPYFCSKCGEKITSEDMAFCPKCGNKLK